MKVIIDAKMSLPDDGLFCVCPVEFDENGQIEAIIDGLSIISGSLSPGNEVIGIYHPVNDGSAASKWHRSNLYGIATFCGMPPTPLNRAVIKLFSENHPHDLDPIYGIRELREAVKDQYGVPLP